MFNPRPEVYPKELDIAVKAWQEVSKTTPQRVKKPRALLLDYLNKNHNDLSKEAKERIATVANWDKKGGATRT